MKNKNLNQKVNCVEVLDPDRHKVMDSAKHKLVGGSGSLDNFEKMEKTDVILSEYESDLDRQVE